MRWGTSDDEWRPGCGRERREPSTLRRCAGALPAREEDWWCREAVRAEECAAQPCLTTGVRGERRGATRVRCTPGLERRKEGMDGREMRRGTELSLARVGEVMEPGACPEGRGKGSRDC